MQFEWDARKAAANLTRHGISFEEASEIFGDPLTISIGDPDHSIDEDRFISTGLSRRQRLLVVSHVYRGGRIRIITARVATRQERRQYEAQE
jgi:uncharacterized protein